MAQYAVLGGSNHITGTAEPKVVKFCTRVGYINSNNRMTSPTKGRGYGHVTVFKILPFVVMQRVGLSATAELLVRSRDAMLAPYLLSVRDSRGTLVSERELTFTFNYI